MKKTEYAMYFDGIDAQDVSFVIVEKKTGKISEPVLRCLGNFKNYVVVGSMITKGDFETYTFIQTENIPKYAITITRNNDAESPIKSCELENYSKKELEGEIIKRAKDLIFNF